MVEKRAKAVRGALCTILISGFLLVKQGTTEAACVPRILQASMAKDVAGELRSSAHKFGCHYSGVDCTATGNQFSCELLKTANAPSDLQTCIPSMLARSIERDLSSEVRDATRKFGCSSISSVHCGKDDASRPDWISCNVVFQDQGQQNHNADHQSSMQNDPASESVCDLTILTNTLSHELFEVTQKAVRRYDCPLLDSISCTSNSLGWVDCATNIDDSSINIPATCNMQALTEKISAEFGEELADAEAKFECPIPPQLDCGRASKSLSTYNCKIGRTGTKEEENTDTQSSKTTTKGADHGSGGDINAQSDSTESGDMKDSEKQDTKRGWKFRYFRGKRTL